MSQIARSPAAGRRAVRAALATAVALTLLAPVAFLFAQTWSSTGEAIGFNQAERRGVAYLGPLTELLNVVTEAQSAAVRDVPVDAAAVRSAVSAVDAVDRRLGGELRTTQRWTAVRQTVLDRISRGWPTPSAAYVQYSDLVTTLIELNRKVGDVSKLILDPELDAYYVMNATLLRVPDILVDSGRYADLTVLAGGRTSDQISVAQLTAARNRVATDATDLGDGLVKAFGETRSESLVPGLTRQLDDFRTAVDAVAPSTSLLAPAPQRSLETLTADQDGLQRATLALQQAALAELDRLLQSRTGRAERARLLAVVAVSLAVLLVAGVTAGLRHVWLDAEAPLRWRSGLDGERPAPAVVEPGADRELIGVGGPPERPGGPRAAR